MVWLKASVLWLAILVLAILNGILREKALIPAMGPVGAFIASGALLSACVLVVALVGAPWYGRLPSARWLLVGVLWLILTLAFEFGFGLLQNRAWSEMLEAYTFRGGNIWPLVLLSTLLSPWLAAGLRGRVA